MKELTNKDFTTTIAKGDTVVDFWAPWCGPCRLMAPVFEQTSKEHKDVNFAKVNTDENQQIAQSLGIRGIPTMIFFKDGKEVMRHVGYADKHLLEAKVRQAFAKA